MFKKFNFFTALTLFLAGQAHADFATKFQNKETLNIVQFGDGHTAGKVFPNTLLAELKKHNPNVNLHYYGKNGSILFNLAANRSNWKEVLKEHSADLVILAYGTNEALSENFFSISQQKRWLEIIAYLKDNNMDVLMLSAPEVYLKNGRKDCLTYPNLDKVFETQKETATATRTYFWDWQKAMGGKCGMRTWEEQGLARNDGVHLTTAGYKKLAEILASDLKKYFVKSQ